MKRYYRTGILFIALLLFTLLPSSNCVAAETEGVEGRSYLTFLLIYSEDAPWGHGINHLSSMGILSFEEGGTFNMLLLEEELEGTGTYQILGQLFTAEWMSSDGTKAYTLRGLSIASLVIMGGGDIQVTSGDDEENKIIRFFGIWSELIPD